MNLEHHATKFPDEISPYFGLRWKPHQLWNLDLVSEPGNVESLTWHLHYPFWSSEPPAPLFDLCPGEVIKKPDRSRYHWERCAAADLRYPLHVTRIASRVVILDGIHRLAKLTMLGRSDLRYYVVPTSMLGSQVIGTNEVRR